MIQITSNGAKTMPYQTLFEFLTQVLKWAEENPEVKEKIGVMLATLLKPANDKLDLCIASMRGSEHTTILVSLDNLRDNAWALVVHITKGNSFSASPERRNAAEIITRLINNDSYKNLHQMDYNKQTGAVRNIIKDFRSAEYKGAIEKMGLDFAVDELENANNEFAKVLDTRVTQSAEKVSYSPKEVRKEAGNALNMIFNHLNGWVVVEGEAKYEAAFKKMNALIVQYANKPKKPATSSNTPTEKPTTPTVPETPIEKYPDAKEWTNMVDVGDFKLGDICFMVIDGVKKYYEMIDASNFNVRPNGGEGELGWKPVE